MDLRALLFLTFLLFSSGIFPLVLSGHLLWGLRNGNKMVVGFALLLFAVAAEDLLTKFVSRIFVHPTQPPASFWFAITYWTGVAVKAVAAWGFYFYLLAQMRRPKKSRV